MDISSNTSGRRPLANSQSPGDEGYADDETNDRRSRNAAETDDLGLISKDEAWQFDIAELLDSPTTIPIPTNGQKDGNNFKEYDPAKSLFVLCVLGSLTVQLDLLW
jgi:hypothetical protein